MLNNREWELINFAKGEKNAFIGDDCAVWNEKSLVVTTDHFCENIHFNLSFMPAEAVGWRLMAANASDVISMGSKPTHYLLNIAIPDGGFENAKKMIEGIHNFAEKYRIELLGGDTTAAEKFTLGVTMFGEKPEKPLLRSVAKPGDFVYLASETGLSLCGYKALKKGLDGFEKSKERFLYPDPFLHIPHKISELNAAIDISDSLLSELRLLCALSDVSIKIDAEKIPVHEEVALGSKLFSIPLLNLLFGSGEEFIMLFSADREIEGAYKIGRVTNKPGQQLEITYENSAVDADSIKLFSHFG
ncbi:thiamine-phosphate kinase [bacterium]|nr:thiamine-phosphate kinase [bacterium]